MRKRLAISKETLTELTGDDLAAVVGAASVDLTLVTRYVDASTPTLDDTCR